MESLGKQNILLNFKADGKISIIFKIVSRVVYLRNDGSTFIRIDNKQQEVTKLLTIPPWCIGKDVAYEAMIER